MSNTQSLTTASPRYIGGITCVRTGAIKLLLQSNNQTTTSAVAAVDIIYTAALLAAMPTAVNPTAGRNVTTTPTPTTAPVPTPATVPKHLTQTYYHIMTVAMYHIRIFHLFAYFSILAFDKREGACIVSQILPNSCLE